MVQYVGENAKSFTTEYGNVSAASIGAIQRGLLTLEEQGGDVFFGEPMLDINDLMQTDDGKGIVNILAADKLMSSPRLYSTFCSGCCRSSSSSCRKSATWTSRSSSSSSTKRISCSTKRRQRCSRRSSRSCA